MIQLLLYAEIIGATFSITSLTSEQPRSNNTPVPDLYEVFCTPYTTEEVARGVRAKQNIARGVLVEVAHCIRIPREEYVHHLRYSVLEHYLYVGRDGGMLMALGVGSLFNHSQQPNLNYTVDHDQLIISYRAARDIAAQEELTITYGSSSKLWFVDRSMDSVESSRISMLHEDLDDEAGFLGAFQLDNGSR
ncbi:hypothetical protein KC19_4G156800 [Ceratodon purpureus]|uniref:SET domain-containing protein n=1 Tax=Ceratodon purpureus TaxID=3225 RepID=A0A8T0IBL3_CERPU|nr:hypothetical protein KC19_4G156800 [Ceratodon purpureus]